MLKAQRYRLSTFFRRSLGAIEVDLRVPRDWPVVAAPLRRPSSSAPSFRDPSYSSSQRNLRFGFVHLLLRQGISATGLLQRQRRVAISYLQVLNVCARHAQREPRPL